MVYCFIVYGLRNIVFIIYGLCFMIYSLGF